MIAHPYHYYLFQPGDLNHYLDAFGSRYKNTESAKLEFNEWLDTFLVRSILFHTSQERRITTKAEGHFWSSHGLERDDYLDSEQSEAWAFFRETNGIDAMRIDCEHMVETNRRTRESLGHRHRYTASDVLREIGSGTARVVSWKEANALWFNRQISNTQEMIARLKDFPYETYLRTTHWARVRSAMFLIHRGSCQEISEYRAMESWYLGDWEADLHVHHLDYTNLGNERYDDLVLLCSRHHKQWHTEIDASGKSTITLADD